VTDAAPRPPFSRALRVDRLPARRSEQAIEADAAECAAIADAFALQAVEALAARIELEPIGRRGVVRLDGRLTARVVQTCGVTLAPVPAEVESRFQLRFAPPEEIDEETGEIEIAYADSDPPDPIEGGEIDLGQVVLEQLALALDPFPRAPGAVFQPPVDDDLPAAGETGGPFARLAQLRQKLR